VRSRVAIAVAGNLFGGLLSALGPVAARALARVMGLLLLGSLVEGAVDPVAQRIRGLVGERLVQVAQDDADQQVHLACPGPEALDRRGGQLRVGGGGKYPDFLDHAGVGTEGIADPAAEG
jgi:hypothetical protein